MSLKVTGIAAILASVCIVTCTASPMFGIGGMMSRKFPGSSDMSYRRYREIASNQQQRSGNTPVATRSGANDFDEPWMFDNEIALRTGAAVPAFNRQPSQQQFQDSDEQYLFQYPSSFSPRESYAYINFPYHAPIDVQYRKTHKNKPEHRIYNGYYY